METDAEKTPEGHFYPFSEVFRISNNAITANKINGKKKSGLTVSILRRPAWENPDLGASAPLTRR